MWWKRLIASVIVVGSVCVILPEAPASVFEPVSDQQLVCEATDIIRGEVTEVQAAWDSDHTAIWTTATVHVEEALRGQLARGAVVPVKEVGGTADGYTIEAEGFPTFRNGEEVVLLLRPWDEDPATYRVWGYGRGLFVVGQRGAGSPTVTRHDVVEAGHATMFTDQIPSVIVLDALTHQLGQLAGRCRSRGSP